MSEGTEPERPEHAQRRASIDRDRGEEHDAEGAEPAAQESAGEAPLVDNGSAERALESPEGLAAWLASFGVSALAPLGSAASALWLPWLAPREEQTPEDTAEVEPTAPEPAESARAEPAPIAPLEAPEPAPSEEPPVETIEMEPLVITAEPAPPEPEAAPTEVIEMEPLVITAEPSERPIEEVRAQPEAEAPPPEVRVFRRRPTRAQIAAAEARAWRAQFDERISQLPESDFSSVIGGPDEIRRAGSEAAEGRRAGVPEIRPEAEEAVPDRPELEEVPEEPPPDPVPAATALVEDASNLTLPDQELPTLTASPLGHTPRIVRAPAGARDLGARFIVEVEAPPTPIEEAEPGEVGEETAERQRAVDEATSEEPQAEGAATAEPITLHDEGAPAPPVFTEGERGDIARVVARLFVDTDRDVDLALRAARERAYPRGALQENAPTFGEDRKPEFKSALETELRAIAEAAGVADRELDQAIERRREDLAAAAGEQQQCVEDASQAAEEEVASSIEEEQTETERAIDGLQRWLDEQVAATSGEYDPAAVRAQRDGLIDRLHRRVAEQAAGYRQQGERRQRDLDAAQRAIRAAYRAAASRDEELLYTPVGLTPGSEAAEGETEEQAEARRSAAGSWRWGRVATDAATARIEELETAASTASAELVGAIETAGREGTQLIRAWADERIGAQQSWWQRLIQRVLDWWRQASMEANTWATSRATENATAAANDLQLLRTLTNSREATIQFSEQAQMGNLSEEEAAVFSTFFGEGEDQHNAIAAVAAATRIRLHRQRVPAITESLRGDVLSLPYDQWRLLNLIGEAQRPGFHAEQVRSELYEAMHGGLTGAGTDEDRVYRALAGLTPEQARAVRAVYRRRHGVELDDDIGSEFSGSEETRARALLSGDQAVADAAALYDAMHGGLTGLGTDEALIMSTLRNKSPEERQRIIDEYRRISGGRDLMRDIDDEMDDNDQRQAEAHMAGETARADAIAIESAMSDTFLGTGWGTDEEAIEAVYTRTRSEVEAQARREGWTYEQMQAEYRRRIEAIETEFGNEFARGYEPEGEESVLDAAYRGDLSGDTAALIRGLHDADGTAEDVARLNDEFRAAFVTDDDAINRTLARSYERAQLRVELDADASMRDDVADYTFRYNQRPPQEWMEERQARRDAEVRERLPEVSRENMEAVEAAFDRDRGYEGALRLRLAFNTSGADQSAAYERLDNGGYLPPEQEIEFAIEEGNEEGVPAVLRRLDRQGLEELRARYESVPGRSEGDFLEYLEGHLEGRDLRDARSLLDPRRFGTPEERLALEEERVRWELDNSTEFWAGGQRSALESQLEDLESTREELARTPEDDPRRQFLVNSFDSQARGIEHGINAYREGVDSGLDTLLTIASIYIAVAAIVAIVVIEIVTVGGATPLVVAGVAAVAGALGTAVTVGTKAAVLGDAYTSEQMWEDIGTGIVDTAIGVATAGVGDKILRSARIAAMVGQRLIPRMIATGVSEGVESMLGSAPGIAMGLYFDENVRESTDSAGVFLEGMGTGLAMSVGMDMAMSQVSGPMMRWANRTGFRAHGMNRVDAYARQGRPVPPEMQQMLIDERVPGFERLLGGGEVETPHIDPPEVRVDEALPDLGTVGRDVDAEVQRAQHADRPPTDETGLPGTPEERAALYARFVEDNPGATRADFERALEEGSVGFANVDAEVARHRAAMREELMAMLSPAERQALGDVEIVVLGDAAFAAKTRSASGDAVVIIVNGRPVVVVREGAHLGKLREEGGHLQQYLDPNWRPRLEELSEEQLGDWDTLEGGTRLAKYDTKIDVEVDAYERLIRHLDQEIANLPEGPARERLQARRAEAERTLGNLRDRRAELDALTDVDRAEIASGARRPDYLEQPARMFSKSDQPAVRARELAKPLEIPEDSPLVTLAETVLRQQGPGDPTAAETTARALLVKGKAILDRFASYPDHTTAFLTVLELLASYPTHASSFLGKLTPGRTSFKDLLGYLAPRAALAAAVLTVPPSMSDGAPPAWLARARALLGLADTVAVGDLPSLIAARIAIPTGRRLEPAAALASALGALIRHPHRPANVDLLIGRALELRDRIRAVKTLAALADAGVPDATLAAVLDAAAERGAGAGTYLDAITGLARSIRDPILRNDLLLAARHVNDPTAFAQTVPGFVEHVLRLAGSAQTRVQSELLKRLQERVRRAAQNDLVGEAAARDLDFAGRELARGNVKTTLLNLYRLYRGVSMRSDPWATRLTRAADTYGARRGDSGDFARHEELSDALDDPLRKLSDSERGVIWDWRKPLTNLAERRGVPVGKLLDEMLAGGLRLESEADYEAFRRRLRHAVLSHLLKAHTNVADQIEQLRLLLDLQPDSASKGALFAWYRRMRLGLIPTLNRSGVTWHSDTKTNKGTLAHMVPTHGDPLLGPTPGTDEALPGRRSADGVAEITGTIPGDDPPPRGAYMLDDKAGGGAFDPDQFERYVRQLLTPPPGQIANRSQQHTFDGLVYVCDSESSAEAALKDAQRRLDRIEKRLPPELRAAFVEENLNVYFVYFDSTGQLRAFGRVHAPQR